MTMPDMPDSLTPKAHNRGALLWLIATVIGAGAGIASWIYHLDGVVRVIANTSTILALPGWALLRILGVSGVRDSIYLIIIANATAWLIWIGFFLIVLHLRTIWIKRPSRARIEPHPDPSRRAFLCNATIGTATVAAVAAPGYATLVEPWQIKVRRYTIPINGLDPSLEGLRLVQLADTHLGPLVPASFIRQAVDLVIAQQPDLVLLTGDYVQDGTDDNELAAKLCRPLVRHATIGAVGVLGNHDWWGNGEQMSTLLTLQNIDMIDNDRIWIDARTRKIKNFDPGPGSLAIVGFGDLTDDHIDTDRAFRDIATHTPRIVLSHNPDSAELHALTKSGAPRIDLMCSGHTHGGQVRIPLLGTPMVPSKFGSKYAGGLVDGPAFRVHISRGIGMSLLPVRVGVPPEISVMTLMRA